MQVVLLDNIRGVGRIGDIKIVSDGYARNFLLPRKLGKPANAAAVKEAELLKARSQQASTMVHEQALEVASKLSGLSVSMQAKANERGTLFSGISAEDIAKQLSELSAVRIPPQAITLPEHLKLVGTHTVHVTLSEGVSTDVSIQIVPES